MNKVFLAILIAAVGMFSTLTASPEVKVTVNQTSKNAVLESFWKASIYGDRDALWSVVLPPKVKDKKHLETMKQSFVQNYFANFPLEVRNELKKIVNTPDWKGFVDEASKEFEPYVVQSNGKWYIDMWKMIGEKNKDVKLPPCPKQVNHSTQNDLILSFLLGIYYENDEIVWNSFEPSFRKAVEAQIGEKTPKGIAKNSKNAMPQNVLVPAIKTLVSGEVKAEDITMPGVKLVKINGKWYITPAKK